MSHSILKYKLNFPGYTELEVPTYCDECDHSDVLSVKVQDQRDIVLYVSTTNPNGKTQKLKLYCAETGINTLPEPDEDMDWWYLDTCMLGDGSYVIHVFSQDWPPD